MPLLQLAEWLLVSFLSFAAFVVNSYIFISEKRKRVQRQLTFPSKSLSLSSYLCIALGPWAAITRALRYFNGICVISANIEGVVFYLQFAAMECYQLSRIYYCFSANAVHSNNGYQNYVFVIIVIWLCCVIILGIITSDLSYPTVDCHIDSKGNAHITYSPILSDGMWYISYYTVNVLILALDITTVLLYWYKICSFKRYRDHKHQDIQHRIQSILHRVLTLTLLYQLTIFWAVVTINAIVVMPSGFDGELLVCAMAMASMAFSVSMYLMQDHNTKEYVQFLCILKRFKLHLCCCCCSGMVENQYQAMVVHVNERRIESSNTDTDTVHKSVKPCSTRTGMEMSIDTVTVQYGEDCVI